MASEHRTDESLKVLPLKANITVVSDDKKEDKSMTVTSSTQAPMTEKLSETEIKHEMINNEGGTIEAVNNDSDNQTNKPQMELVAGDEMDVKSRSNQEKEGRAINFPMEVSSNHQNSTLPGHMQSSINFVTTSTEKPNVMSFFDLSDVNMDHDDNEHRDTDNKAKTTTTTAATRIIVQCFRNGTLYKVSWEVIHWVLYVSNDVDWIRVVKI